MLRERHLFPQDCPQLGVERGGVEGAGVVATIAFVGIPVRQFLDAPAAQARLTHLAPGMRRHHALTTLISRMETSRDKTEKENCVPVSLFHPGNRLFLSGDVAVPLRRRSWSAQATFPVSPEPGTKDG